MFVGLGRVSNKQPSSMRLSVLTTHMGSVASIELVLKLVVRGRERGEGAASVQPK